MSTYAISKITQNVVLQDTAKGSGPDFAIAEEEPSWYLESPKLHAYRIPQ